MTFSPQAACYSCANYLQCDRDCKKKEMFGANKPQDCFHYQNTKGLDVASLDMKEVLSNSY